MNTQELTAEDVLHIIAGYVMCDDRTDDTSGTLKARMMGRNSVKAGVRDILAKYKDYGFED